MVIDDPSDETTKRYDNSVKLCEPFYKNLGLEKTRIEQEEIARAIKKDNQLKLVKTKTQILESSDETIRRVFDSAYTTGTSSWITVKPNVHQGFFHSHKQFQDTMAVRYNSYPGDAPSYCRCGEKASILHILSCKNGGLPIIRYNATGI
ncbi:hypothetical protein GJ496_001139 [Pomphorhynchus laevis]|nr:hypothetical protein GJ496_001139 [Pomphorhynchus laevis]